MLDIFLRAVRASKEWEFMWHQIGKYTSELLREASPRAVVLVFPYIRWNWLEYYRDAWVRRWVWAVSGAPDTERVSQSIIDTLLQIASKEELLPHIPINIWSWLTTQPPLPAICLGRSVGTCAHVVKAVRALRDIEILKSYFLLVWSEWNHISPDSSSHSPYDTSGGVSGCPPIYIHPLPHIHHPIHLHHTVHVADGVLSHHTSSSSDSVPVHLLPHVLDSPPHHHSSSSSDRTPSNHTPSNPNSVSVCPLPPDNTLSHYSTRIADHVSSRRTSISSASTPSSPPLHIIPIDMPIHYSPPIPIGIPTLQPPILQPQILDLPPIPVGIPTRHSSSSSNNTLNHGMPNGSDNVSDHHPLPPDSTPSHHLAYIADSMSSHRTSIGFNSTLGHPLHPISKRIPQPLVQPPLLAQPPPISPPFNAVMSSTPSFRMLDARDSIWIPQSTLPPPSEIMPINPLVSVVQDPGELTDSDEGDIIIPSQGTVIQNSEWIAQPLMRPPSIGPPVPIILPPPGYAVPNTNMLNIQDSRSDLRPPHVPNNMPSSHLSGGFFEMQISIREDFGGIGMRHHRADLLQRLDHVIGRLDRGLEYLKQQNPGFNEAYLQGTKHQYQYLREILLEMNAKSEQSYVASNDHVPQMHAEPRATFMRALPLPCP
jgi:hypothetical protein